MYIIGDKRDNIFPRIPSPQRDELINSIAAIRTDLDSFHDIEAYSLMYTGYKMCEDKMNKYWNKTTHGATINWNFLVPNELISKIGKTEKKLLGFLGEQ